jgi:hypothetical protein
MRGIRAGALALSAAALLIGLAGVGGAATTKSARPMLGLFITGQESWTLSHVNPLTLKRARGLSLRVGTRNAAWSFSPDRSKLVLADYANTGTLLLVDTGAMRSLGVVDLGAYGFVQVQATFWPDQGRLYALVTRLTRREDGNFERSPSSIVTVDPATRKVVAERPLDGWAYNWAHGAGVLVFLLGPEDGVGPARLAVVGSDGSVRTVGLAGIQVGYDRFDPDHPTQVGRYETPGIVVAPDGTRAFVASPGQLAAVDLRSLDVSYHRLGAMSRRLQKGANEGKLRIVRMLGPERLLVTGSDDTVSVDSNGAQRVQPHPIGLQIVYTRDWSVTTIDPTTSYAVVTSNGIFATSLAWNAQKQRALGGGATIYDLSGAMRAHIFKGQEVYALAVGSRAFVARDGQRYTIVSTPTGKIVRTLNGVMPEPLVGPGQG